MTAARSTPIGAVARLLAAAVFFYLAWLAVVVGFGAAESYEERHLWGIEGEWLFAAGLVLATAALVSAVLSLVGWGVVIRLWNREPASGFLPTLVRVIVALILVTSAALVLPAAEGAVAHHDVSRDFVILWPAGLLIWPAVLLAADAMALAALVVGGQVLSGRMHPR